MPLRKRLVLEFSPAEESPLPVILTVEKNGELEELHCVVQPSWTEGVFRVTLDLGSVRLPRAIAQSHWHLRDSMVSVCASPAGHLFLEAGQHVSLTFTTWDDQQSGTTTIDAGILIDFTIP